MGFLRIKELLKEKGVTSKDLAEHLGMTEPGVSRIINEKRQPRFEILQQVAGKLGVEIWELFSGSGESVTGCLKYQGKSYDIRSRKDLEELLRIMK